MSALPPLPMRPSLPAELVGSRWINIVSGSTVTLLSLRNFAGITAVSAPVSWWVFGALSRRFYVSLLRWYPVDLQYLRDVALLNWWVSR